MFVTDQLLLPLENPLEVFLLCPGSSVCPALHQPIWYRTSSHVLCRVWYAMVLLWVGSFYATWSFRCKYITISVICLPFLCAYDPGVQMIVCSGCSEHHTDLKRNGHDFFFFFLGGGEVQENPLIIFISKEIYKFFKLNDKIPVNLVTWRKTRVFNKFHFWGHSNSDLIPWNLSVILCSAFERNMIYQKWRYYN